MKPRMTRRVLMTAASAACLLCISQSFGGQDVSAQAPQAGQSQAPGASTPQFDPYDRVALLWYKQRLAESGPERGKEIFYMSCWMCHNEYTAATTTVHAPLLDELFTRGGVSDEALMARIRGGGFRMPAYSPAMLSDQDVTDVIAFLRETCATSDGGSCYDEMQPPSNPRYKAQ